MKKTYFGFIMMLIIAVSFAGCGGGGGGAPGSSGSEDTGILITAVSVVGESTGPDEPPDIDVAVHLCDGDEPEDGLFRVPATMSITAELVNPDTAFVPFPASVEQCTISYRKAIEDPASPIIESWTIFPNCPITDGDNTCEVQLIDVQRKIDWWNDISGGVNLPAEYPTHYVAIYNCRYVNRFGESGDFQTEYDIWLADFDTC
jgi:hypothetical protein